MKSFVLRPAFASDLSFNIRNLTSKFILRIRKFFMIPLLKQFFRFFSFTLIFLGLFILAGWALVFGIPVATDLFFNSNAQITVSDSTLLTDSFYKKTMLNANKELKKLEATYSSLTPNQAYMVINTTKNHFFLYRKKKLISEGFCSSGSYIQLKSNDDREWIFKTPKGVRKVTGKTTAPVWRKPDWVFIEEGLPVPPPDHQSRFERGVLGDYAISLGDGYLIHGTLYKRQLGMPVTHGCVRLGDEDLKMVYKTLSIGSKVFIY